jgi:hypothetical protein
MKLGSFCTGYSADFHYREWPAGGHGCFVSPFGSLGGQNPLCFHRIAATIGFVLDSFRFREAQANAYVGMAPASAAGLSYDVKLWNQVEGLLARGNQAGGGGERQADSSIGRPHHCSQHPRLL